MRPPESARSPRDWSRRDFGRAVAGAASAAVLGTEIGLAQVEGDRESLLGRFCRSLNDEQRRVLVLPFADPKRTMVQNHWAVVPATIASLTADQHELALELIRQVCTTEGFARLTRQRLDDAGGWKHDHLAVFGSPTDPRRFEWVLTGRHLTLRGSPTGSITGGPLFFGHTTPGSENLGARIAEAAGALGRELHADQQRQAAQPGEAGLDLAELGSAQQAIARQFLSALIEPFRAFEVPAVATCLGDGSPLVGVRWEAFPAERGSREEAPRVWRLSGPGFRWSFHADPHVHLWFDSV